MAEYKTDVQVNYGFGLSFEATGKAPVVAKRIWETLADAQAYVDTATDTAIAGLVLTVINDTDASNNGVYFVKSIGGMPTTTGEGGTTKGVLVKLGSAGDMVSVDSSDNILYTDGTKIKAGVSLGYNSSDKKMYLYGYDTGKVISTIDCKDFVKDGMLKGSALYTATGTTGSVAIAGETYQLSGLTSGKTYIVLVWNSDAEVDPMTIDVTTLIDTYTGGTAITVNDKTIDVNKDVVDGWIDTKVNALDSTKTSTDNGYFTVTVTQADGKITSVSSTSNLGTAAKKAEGDFATAAQGAKADTAVQGVIVGADEAYIAVSDKDTNNSVTVSATDALKTAVTKAGSALQDAGTDDNVLISVTVDTNKKATIVPTASLKTAVTNANSAVQSAAGDTYVSASVASNKVTVAATDALKTAVTKANNSVQYSEDTKSVPVGTSDDTKKITGVATPTENTDAANKTYVDSAVKTITDNYVKSFGGKTGAITVKGGSTTNGDVNLSMSNNELQASIVGLGSVIDSKVSIHNTSTAAHSDIRTAISNEVTRATAAEKTNSDAITKLNGDASTTGSVAKAVADAKSALLGDAGTDYNTLGKLEDKIIEVSKEATAGHTVVNKKDSGHVTVTVESKTDSSTKASYSAVTVAESDIASAKDLSDEITRAKGVESGLDTRLTAVEGKIPTEASSTNQLADKAYVTNAVKTATDAVDKIEESVGLNADGTHKTTTGNYTKTATTIAGEIAALDTQVYSNTTNITTNTNAIATLNGEETVTGSVKQIAKAYAEAAMVWTEF